MDADRADVVLVVRHQPVQKLCGVAEDPLGVVPVVGDLGRAGRAARVGDLLAFEVKHDARGVHDHLDAGGRVAERLDLDNVVLAQRLERRDSLVERGQRLVKVGLRVGRDCARGRGLLVRRGLLHLDDRLLLGCRGLVDIYLLHHELDVRGRPVQDGLQVVQLALHRRDLLRRRQQLGQPLLETALHRFELRALVVQEALEGPQQLEVGRRRDVRDAPLLRLEARRQLLHGRVHEDRRGNDAATQAVVDVALQVDVLRAARPSLQGAGASDGKRAGVGAGAPGRRTL